MVATRNIGWIIGTEIRAIVAMCFKLVTMVAKEITPCCEASGARAENMLNIDQVRCLDGWQRGKKQSVHTIICPGVRTVDTF